MIDHHTIKFGPAVSQKELEKALHEGADPHILDKIHKMKARIEVIADFDDLKKVIEFIKQLSKQ